MLKQLILLFNLFSFIIITALLPADIKVETKLPENSTFVIDSMFIVEVDITKGPIYGFAKFQQNIPEGYIAQPVETADASFTFADGKIKFIWMAIPETEHVKISYALTATSAAPAEGIIDGKLSYIEDNERKSYDIPSIPIKAISDEPVVEKVPAMASVSRTVKDLGDNTYEVSLSFEKKGIEGFGKLEEYLPEGAEASVLENNKAVFSQVDEKSKFVWMAVPQDEQFTVSYKVESESDISDALAAMEGNFSFLDGNDTKTVAVLGEAPIESEPVIAANTEDETETEESEPTDADESEPMMVSSDSGEGEDNSAEEGLAENNIDEKESEYEEVNETEAEPAIATVEPVEKPVEDIAEEVAEEVVEEAVDEEPVENMVADAGTSNTEAKRAKMNNLEPETGISYKVQIAAGKKLVSETFLRKTYKYPSEQYNVENHEGWVKYTTGDFAVYKGARDKREQLVSAGHNFPGPFVTAYNGGERITVQEALMISNQKWFK